MTQTPKIFKNLSDEQIEDIIAQVEASKPWSGGLRGIELFLLNIISGTHFMYLGTILLIFLHYVERFNFTQKSICFIPFITLDIVYFFKKPMIDKMSIRDWCIAILTNTSPSKDKQFFFKVCLVFCSLFLIFYGLNVYLDVFYNYRNPYLIFIPTFMCLLILSIVFKFSNIIAVFVFDKTFFSELERIIGVKRALSGRIILGEILLIEIFVYGFIMQFSILFFIGGIYLLSYYDYYHLQYFCSAYIFLMNLPIQRISKLHAIFEDDYRHLLTSIIERK